LHDHNDSKRRESDDTQPPNSNFLFKKFENDDVEHHPLLPTPINVENEATRKKVV